MNTHVRVHAAFRVGALATLLLAPLAAIAQDSVPIPATSQPPVRIAEAQKNSGAQVGRDASGRPVLTLDGVPSNFMGSRPRRASLEDDARPYPYHKAGLEFLKLRINAGVYSAKKLTRVTSNTYPHSGPAKGRMTARLWNGSWPSKRKPIRTPG